MHFQAAYSYMKRGHAITLPEWGGYWTWDEASKTIMMHTRGGDLIDMRQSTDMDYTLSFLFRTDWELVTDTRETEHYQALVELRGPTA